MLQQPGVINFLIRFIFDSVSWTSIVGGIMYIAGLWRIFEKSGIQGWWALVPCYKEYQLGRCAGREPEGRTLFLMACLTKVLGYSDYWFRLFRMDQAALEVAELLYGVIDPRVKANQLD